MSPPFHTADKSHSTGRPYHEPHTAASAVKSSMEPSSDPASSSPSSSPSSSLGHDTLTVMEPRPLVADAGGPDDLMAFDPEPQQPAAYEKQKQAHRPEPLDLGPGAAQPSSDQQALDLLGSSTATLKPSTPMTTTATQYTNIESKPYVDPTPATPWTSQPPSRTPSSATDRPRLSLESLPGRSDDERRNISEDEREHDGSEIQHIMAQFKEGGGGPGEEEVMSPRLEIASPFSPKAPRKSSLEPVGPAFTQQLQSLRLEPESPADLDNKGKDLEDQGPPVPPKDPSILSNRTSHLIKDDRDLGSPMSPTVSLHRPPPPEPEPESALPFDFHRFLEQLRNKKADPVAKYLRSFLNEFAKRQWMVHEQVKIISDFLAFIANKMALCDVWKDVSDAEFDNAREGMEKLVMNRLYAQTFSPAIPPPQPIPGGKPRRRGGERPMGPGRRGQHQEDVERDEVVAQKIQIYGWVREEHLDIPTVGESGKRFLKLAQQELLKIKSYRAPRDKIICILNCCKVIFGLLKHSKSDSSADSFMPLLIYVTLQANPEHIVSNVQYILRFRNQDKLGGEAGYYLSSLMGALQFIENMDRTTLTITDEEFEKNVEAAVSAIAEKHRLESPPSTSTSEKSPRPSIMGAGTGEPSSARQSIERHHQQRPADDGNQSSSPHQSTSSNDDSGDYDEKAAIAGLLRTIQKPLSTIGRMFSDDGGSGDAAAQASSSRSPAHTPVPPGGYGRGGAGAHQQQSGNGSKYSAEEAAARQASAEVAEAQRLHRAEHANIVETLAGMFPDLDKDIISDVVYQKEGRVGLAVDACLALSS
ncbi:hypothetical protein BD289DRAFT_439100 [Coniella lustricola]|uniref:Guanine nucleotide exchange factor Vps9 n=1 Tax=Coniella lustricola TaxID=2025994 RepID=A0A2T3A222_9PEZI|nr:hypothetical protein BD289DRAFT_439100 [Coniella lustricola]